MQRMIKTNNGSTWIEDVLEHYSKSLINFSELEGGWSAKAFKVVTNDGIFFLKVYDKEKASTQIWTAAIDTYIPIVVWLNNNTKLKNRIICPILTNSAEYKYEDEKFICLLFPYIDGYTLGKKPMSSQQIKEIAEILAELHKYGAEIPIATSSITEDFAVPYCKELKEILSSVSQSQSNETETILRQFEGTLIINIDKVEKLSEQLSKEAFSFVLCHTDVHGWNLMQSDRLILIDWEGMKLAPPEADLFAFRGNLFWHNCSEEFMKIYQTVHTDFKINPEVLEFYQTRRRIEDICAFSQELLYDKNIDEAERKESLYHLQCECEALSK